QMSALIDKSVCVRLTPALLAFLRNAATAPDGQLTADCLSSIRRILDSVESDNEASSCGVSFALIKSVRDCLASNAKQSPPPPPLWRLLVGSELLLPKPPDRPPNPELAARLERLRAEQAQREYDRMTADVRSTPLGSSYRNRQFHDADDSLGSQLRMVNRQLATVVNFLLTVGAAFAFGYKACELASSERSAPLVYKMAAGLLLAAVVFFADLYFVVKLDYLSGKKKAD
ncbi:hypothetical protein BOX15_Mlig019216g1, partial [Macrostomum lignano]